MSKHTPGPWYVERYDVMALKPEREHLGEGAPETICGMISSVSPEETRCNQQLIAAAPELLDALKRVRDAFYIKGTSKALRAAFEGTKELVAKAEGRTT